MPPEQIIAGLLALLGGTWTALIAGFFRGDLIPGHVYRALVNQNLTQAKTIEDFLRWVRGKRDAPPG